MNVQGLCPQTRQSKVPYIRDLLLGQNQLFIAINETWLYNELAGEINIQNYTLFKSNSPRNAKKKKRGRQCGGVAIYLRNDIACSFKELLSYATHCIQALILYSNKLNIIIINLYRQPDDSTHGHPSKFKDFKLLIDKIENILSDLVNVPLVIFGGDFNLPHMYGSKDNPTKEEHLMIECLQTLCCDYSLSQIIDTSTHKDGNILDLIFTNVTEHVHSHAVIPNLPSITHHFTLHIATCFDIESKNPKQQTKNLKTFAKHNFFHKDTNWVSIKNDLTNTNWDTEFASKDINEMFDTFYEQCYKIVSNHVPMKDENDKPKKSITEKKCRNLTRRRRRINQRLMKIKSPSTRENLHKELVEIEMKLQKLYKNYKNFKEQKAIDAIKLNPKFFYSYAKSMSKSKTDIGPLLTENNEITSDGKEMAEILADQYCKVFSIPLTEVPTSKPTKIDKPYKQLKFTEHDFVVAINELSNSSAAGPDNFPALFLKNCKHELSKPLHTLWENSFNSGIVPSLLKECIITPTHKGGSKADAENYRPIALTSHLIKIFEKILRNHLTSYMIENSLFNSNQHGFRKGHSCLSELLAHYDNILNFLDRKMNVDVIYLDFAKAFDKVDFGVVLQKIKNLGVDTQTIQWLSSFLKNRSQKVIVNGQASNSRSTKSGVPQGSVIGPLIFLILLGDIDINVIHSIVRSFADDTRALNGIQNAIDTNHLQNDLNVIYKWTTKNNMKLNELKFELLRYGTNEEIKRNTQYISPTMSIIKEKSVVKDLGVLLSTSNYNFKEQIDNVIEKGKQMSSWIFRTFNSRNQFEMLTLYKSLVLPKIEYCSILWNPTKIHDIQRIEQLQWSFIKKIRRDPKANYWECLNKFKIYSLQRRRERYIIIYVWKILEKLVPNINNKITANYHKRLGRRCNVNTSYSNLQQQQINVHGVALFNKMPKHIRDSTNTSLDSFKRTLDQYLTKLPDEAHVPAHPPRRAKSNSLLDVIGTYNLDRGRAFNCSS